MPRVGDAGGGVGERVRLEEAAAVVVCRAQRILDAKAT